MASSDVVIAEEVLDAIPKPKTTGEGETRVIRQRSKIACRRCRRRKVRCDVYPCGAPCTNCRLDDTDCTPNERRRSYVNRKQRGRKTSPGAHGATGASHEEIWGGSSEHSPEVPQVARHASPREVQVRFLENNQFLLSPPNEIVPDKELNYRSPHTTSTASTDKSHVAGTLPEAPPQNDLPSYVRYDLSHLSNEDISYLQVKGCFVLPKKDVLDDLLKCYFDYIHPHVPFLDEQEFWETYLNPTLGTPQFHHSDGYHISLLLFQAVVFAATTCASLSILHKAGYRSRRVARRDAFCRVRALYSLDVEKEEMVLLQTLLLMSFWQGASGEDKDAWHWSGLAISVASSLCLHRQPNTQLTERQKTLRKRCWWSCVLRDRLLALSEQRAPRVHLNEYDVPLLTLADYNVGLRSTMNDLSPGEELGKRTALSMFSLQLIRLVLCVGKEGPSQSGDLNSSSSAAVEVWTRTRLATHDDGSMTGLADLDFWRLNLPEVLQHLPDSAGDDTVLPCILVHRNALQIYYHKLILSICVPRLLNPASQRELDHNSQLAHRSSVTLAKLYDELVDCDSIHCVPRECFGSSTNLDQANLLTAQGFEPTRGDETQVTRVYTSIMAGAGIVHPTSADRAISSPLASGRSRGREPQQIRNTDSVNAMDIDGYHQLFGFAQRGAANENDVDPCMDFVSDSLWAIPDLAADEPTTSISGTSAPTPTTLLGFEALVEFVKD